MSKAQRVQLCFNSLSQVEYDIFGHLDHTRTVLLFVSVKSTPIGSVLRKKIKTLGKLSLYFGIGTVLRKI